MQKHQFIVILLSALLVACATQSSKPRVSSETPLIEPVSEFLAEQQYLREKLEQNNPRKLSDAEWEQFERIQNNFNALLGDVDSVEQLTTGEKESLYDTRQALVTLLVGEGQLICTKRQPPTGTRMGGGRHCVKRSRLEQESFNADLWRNQFESTPQMHDCGAPPCN